MADDDSQPSAKPMGPIGRYMDWRRNISDLAGEVRATKQRAAEADKKTLIRNQVFGYKQGGKVKATGKAKVHKGEYVIKKAAADKLGPKKLASLNQANRDKKILQKTRFR